MDQKEEVTPKVETPSLPKIVYATQMSRLVSGAIVIIPTAALWVAFYIFILRSVWFVRIDSNVRGIIIMAVFIVPLIVAAVVGNILKQHFYERFQK